MDRDSSSAGRTRGQLTGAIPWRREAVLLRARSGHSLSAKNTTSRLAAPQSKSRSRTLRPRLMSCGPGAATGFRFISGLAASAGRTTLPPAAREAAAAPARPAAGSGLRRPAPLRSGRSSRTRPVRWPAAGDREAARHQQTPTWREPPDVWPARRGQPRQPARRGRANASAVREQQASGGTPAAWPDRRGRNPPDRRPCRCRRCSGPSPKPPLAFCEYHGKHREQEAKSLHCLRPDHVALIGRLQESATGHGEGQKAVRSRPTGFRLRRLPDVINESPSPEGAPACPPPLTPTRSLEIK